MSAICPICKSENFTVIYEFAKSSPYAKSIVPCQIVACHSCSLLYKVKLNSFDISEYYISGFDEHEYFKNLDASIKATREIVNSIKDYLKEKKTLIDLGCGQGIFIEAANNEGLKAVGMELNLKLAAEARNRTGSQIINGNVCEIEKIGCKYDIVSMLDLIEHLEDPVALLKSAHRILNNDGYLIVYTPNHKALIVQVAKYLHKIFCIDKFIDPIFNDVHMVYFDKKTLKIALERCGYKIDKVFFYRYDSSRTNIATGTTTRILWLLEQIASVFNLQFRMLMIAKKIDVERSKSSH